MGTKETEKLKPFIVMEVLERAMVLERQGKSIIHMEIGEPDFQTPRRIIEKAIEALKRGETHYTDSRGIFELRTAVASHYERRYGVEVPEGRVLVTSGTSPALLLVLSTLIGEPGDEIILGDPHYPCYPNFIRYLRGTPRFIATSAEDGFQLKPDAVRNAIGPRSRAVLVNSPSNPTGTLIPREDLETLCGLGLPVISDEIYHGLVYGARENSALEFTDKCFVLNGFSKLFAMTGWRLGYVIAPEEYIRRLQIMQQSFFISPNSFVQWAGISALTENHSEIETMIDMYDSRRRYLAEELPKLGLHYTIEPKGAFYFFVNTEHLGSDSLELAYDILEKAGVALTPGIDFGERGEGHLRISYANSIENITEGIRRLRNYLDERAAT